MITFENYFMNTEAVFKGCKIPKREPDFISKSGSKYWYGINKTGKFVIRFSDHWVKIKRIGSNQIKLDCNRIASCMWHIKTNFKQKDENYIAGKCYLSDFKQYFNTDII